MRSRLTLAFAALAGLLVGCYTPSGVRCSDGRYCPDGTTCDLPRDACVTQDQRDACGALDDGAVCVIGGHTPGVCQGKICRYPSCGDGVRNGAEVCDGRDFGSATCGDHGWYGGGLFCSADCATARQAGCEGYCGDGVLNGGEECDGARRTPVACADLDDIGDISAVGGATACSADCKLVTGTCQWASWRRMTVVPTSAPLAAVWAPGPGDVWAVGEVGVQRFDGKGWHYLGGVNGVATGVGGSGPDDVWVVGSQGTRHFDGTTWSVEDMVPWPALEAVWSARRGDTWAVGEVVLHHDGTGWTEVPVPGLDGASGRSLRAVWGSARDDVWAVGEGGLVLRYDGARWRRLDAGLGEVALDGVRGTAADDVWIVGDGVVLRWDGRRLARVEDAPQRTFTDVWPASDETWFASVDGPLHRHDRDGWHEVPDAPGLSLHGLAGSSDGNLWAVGSEGAILFLRGRGWVTRSASHGGPTERLFVGARGAAWALGPEGTVSRLVDGTWQPAATPATAWSDLWVHDEELAISVGAAGGIRRHQDGRWNDEPSGTTVALAAIWGSSPDDVWAGGYAGTLLRRGFAGWSHIVSPTYDDIALIGGTTPERWWIATANAVFFFDGERWHERATGFGEPPRSVWASGRNDIWAVSHYGELHRFNGRHWNASQGIEPDGRVFRAVWGSGPSDVWAVGDGGLAYHWDGAAWTRVVTGVDSRLQAMGGTGPRDITVVGERRTVLHRAYALPTVPGGACPAPAPISCFGRATGAIVDQPATVGVAGCDVAGGGQAIYRLDSSVPGRLRVSVVARGGDVAVSLLGSHLDDRCNPGRCYASAAAGVRPVVEADVLGAGAAYIVVSAHPGEDPSFTMEVECTRDRGDARLD